MNVDYTPSCRLPTRRLIEKAFVPDHELVTRSPTGRVSNSAMPRSRLLLAGMQMTYFTFRYRFTPYLRRGLFYNGRFDKIAKNSFAIRSVFPLTKRVELQLYYEGQRNSGTVPLFHVRGGGLTLSLFS